mmetsp:Transcript_562/g.997  ORF Transcript_562/g.997 Transcript_562/m.997 type:complete len:555 (+) Transcript_562:158-1822(+)
MNMVVTGSSNTNLGTSVVPDLMRVYESLTQSKTPQTTQAPVPSTERTSFGDSENDDPSRSYQHYDPFSTDHGSTLLRHAAEQHEQHYEYDAAIQAAAAIPPPPSGDEMQQSLSSSQSPSPVQSRERNVKKIRPRRSTSRKRSTAEFDNKSESDSDNAKKCRKGKGADGRWSKRFAWPDELHRDFVSAVFDVGLKHSSPSSLMEQMPPHEQITTERIKSHLQKYRLHRQKSKKEFMASYESSLLKMKSGEHDLDASNMNCGEVAAHLTFSTMNEKEITSVDPASLVQGGVLQLPQLTEEEKRSPVGASMGYLLGLFFSLKQQLQIQREGTFPNGDGSAITPSTSPQSSVALPAESIPSSTSAGATYSVSGWNKGASSTVGTDFHATQDHHGTQFDVVTSASATASHPGHASLYQQQYYQGYSTQTHPASAAMVPGPVTSGTSSNLPSETRSSTVMEESNMMKRDMKSQMVFQNKMRKLKEQELSKYTQATESTTDANAANSSSSAPYDYNVGHLPSQGGDGTGKNDNDAMAMGGSDFWGSEEVLDEKLFEFLMND